MATTVPNTFSNGTNADANQVNANFTAHNTAIDGVATMAGVVTPAVKMRGAQVTSASEARSNTAYGLMTTPDRVTGIVLPSPGIIEVLFHAFWNETVDGAARAAIFIGSNQLQISPYGVAAPIVQEAQCIGAASITEPLTSTWYGLTSGGPGTSATGHTTPVTTGQVIATSNTGGDAASQVAGGKAFIFVNPGTYDVSVQFKASSGTVNVMNRRLYVEAKAY